MSQTCQTSHAKDEALDDYGVSNHTAHLYPSLSNLHVEDEEVSELMLCILKDHVAHLQVLCENQQL